MVHVQVSATAAESFVSGRDVTNPKTLQGALEALFDEIEPNSPTLASSVQYRKNLAMNLFYKVCIRTCMHNTMHQVVYNSCTIQV